TAPPTTAPTGPPTAAPTTTPAAPPPAAPTPVPTGCEPGSPVHGSRLRAASSFAFALGSLLERKRHISAPRPPRAKSAPGVSRSGGAFGRTEAAAAFAGSEQDFPGRAGGYPIRFDAARRIPATPARAKVSRAGTIAISRQSIARRCARPSPAAGRRRRATARTAA